MCTSGRFRRLVSRPAPSLVLSAQGAARPVRQEGSTESLNTQLEFALQHRKAGPEDAQKVLDAAHGTKYDYWTLLFLMRAASNASLDDARRTLPFMVRALQNARRDGVGFHAIVLKHLVPVALRAGKVNISVAVKNLIQKQPEYSVVSALEMKLLIKQFAAMHRTKWMRAAFDELVLVHGHDSVDSDAFSHLLEGYLKNEEPDAAMEVWKMMRNEPFLQRIQMNSGKLELGARMCRETTVTDGLYDITEYIADMYREKARRRVRFVPTNDALHNLASAFIRRTHWDRALSCLQRMQSLQYRIHAWIVRQFVATCVRDMDLRDLPKLAITLSMCEPGRFASSDEQRLDILHAIIDAIYMGVIKGALEPKAAASAGKEVFSRWPRLVEDKSTTSAIMYMNTLGNNLEYAVRTADIHHMKFGKQGMLHTFAYKTFVRRCVQREIKRNTLAKFPMRLIFRESHKEKTDASLRVKLTVLFMHELGRLHRLDLCTALYEKYVRLYKLNPHVMTSYMYVLGMASRPAEAIVTLKRMHEAHGRPKDGITYSALASVVLVNGREDRLSVDIMTQLLKYIDGYLSNIPDAATRRAGLDALRERERQHNPWCRWNYSARGDEPSTWTSCSGKRTPSARFSQAKWLPRNPRLRAVQPLPRARRDARCSVRLYRTAFTVQLASVTWRALRGAT
ncbi:hypothetical protein FVE85_0025 [Porphyridium purpureum]|uniref:Pentatricopeptide repeat-containing protein n=1 Tax=Porphyridium purpureum TaxID=35688 RepID=A0A5J4YYA3_PORPP|nr:hypothetical protein FVE85_0025 [Porphyridium purpureum]|eukprot:POR7414..scf208_2